MSAAPRARTVDAVLGAFPPGVQTVANGARELIHRTLPDVEETVDGATPMISFGYGAGYGGMVCTLILSKTGVKLGLVRGSELTDPRGLLEGSGRVHKYVQLRTPADLKQAGLKPLISAAFAAWQDRQNARKR
jgi:hypothetical protein